MSITEIPLAERYEAIAQAATSFKPGQILSQVQGLQAGVDKESKNEERTIHNAAIDVAFRDALIDVLATTDIDSSDFDRVWNLIDVANILSDNRLCDIPLGYWLVEDLLDSQTIKGCRKVFEYLQSRREAMANKNFEQKQLSVLRCCNELLRRLSRAEDAVFCGRVFIYLFDCFPLGDRSSVNLRAEYHVDNVTTFDVNPPGPSETLKPMDVDTQPPNRSSRAQTPISISETDPTGKISRASPSPNAVPTPTLQDLYPAFWSLQNIFSAPPQLTDPETSQATLEQFKDGISKTLSYFRTVPNNTTSSNMSTEPRTGMKRKAAEMDLDESSIAASAFNPKYLTSQDLFELELHDIEFRRHVLVQTLILLDFLLSWTASNKQKFDTVARNPAMLQKFVLSEADEKWATNTRRDIETYLGTGADGRHYLRMVNMVLARDKNWVLWKAQNCFSIKKNPVPIAQGIEAQESLKKISQTANSLLGVPAGASELSFLSDNVPLEALKHRAENRPSLEAYYKDIQTADLDLDFANTDEEKREIEERKAGSLWRALRSAKGRRFALCEQIKNGDNLQALVNSQDNATDNVNGVESEAAPSSDPPADVEMQGDNADNVTNAVVDAAQATPANVAEA